jgi:hypothetical protein
MAKKTKENLFETPIVSTGEISYLSIRKTPHRCPICGGNGLVDNGFYNQTSGHWSTTDITPEQCRTCNGKGIVWG